MEKFGKSQSVTRVEDVRFLTGAGRYVDDIAPKGALHGFFLRSTAAHGAITELDVSDATDAEGVHAVLTCADLEAAGMNIAMPGAAVKNRDGSDGATPLRPMLAKDHVRYVGEPIALIVADTLAQARDAAEMILVDIDDLPAKVDVASGGQTLHAEAPDNRAFDWAMGDKDAVDAVFAKAAKVVSLDVEDNRIIVNSMEPRGCYAEWTDGGLHVSNNGQGVWSHKGYLQKAFGLEADQVRVTNPDVGGGFGMKAMAYPEYFCCAQAARVLDRPVRWMSERTEAMLSDNGGRDLTSQAEFAFDADNRIIGYRVHSVCNMGAYNSQFAQFIQTQLFSRVLAGVYDVQDTYLHVEGFYTNTTPVDAYRGAGRPEAIYVLERLIDRAARELDVDPWELRRLNFIKPDQFPYAAATGETYDVGDFHRVLARTAQQADQAGFATRKAADAARGLLRGQGLCYYIESILGDPSEGAQVVFHEGGTVSIFVGTQSNGQGHETVYAKFLSDQTGIPADKITVVQGDSDLIATGVVTVDRYTVVDDFGNLINPMLAEGQVHGGVVQGIGQAIQEHVVYDEDGQLLTASFMDYALPRAGDLPHISFTSEPVPSTANIMGMKGCGEAGTVGALAAVANAVQDALWDRGVRQVDMPFTPLKVWELLQDEAIAAE